MATQMVSQPSGSNLFCNSGNFGIGDMYGLHDLSKAEMAAPRLIMLANVALTGEVNSGCCDYSLDEDRQMAELTTVYENSFSDSEGERMELEESNLVSEPGIFESMVVDPSEVQEPILNYQQTTVPETSLEVDPEKKAEETPPARTEDIAKCVKSKPFRCRPCQYKAESEEEFVHHIRDHSAKRFIDHDSNKNVQDSGSCSPEEVDFSMGPIRCDRCGYNTNRFDHYLAHLKHHNKASDNERVYKCTICTYTTVSEYHWKKHLRNHFPRNVYSCSQCSYFSDRKNNYIQHIRTHTGERPYQCVMCPYSSSQKTHLTRHMRTHSGEKPFKCEQCSYVASNQHEVTRHARQVHNGPKPLTCPHCNYKTADRSNFKKHVELHVNPRQFLCPVCDYAASKKCNLQYHIKSRHFGCADITMDVSKVKLRTKKGDAASSDVNLNKQEEKENSDDKNELPEKKTEVEPKADEETCVKVKQAASPPVGQITTRSHKPTSSKTEDTTLVKGKCAKRKLSVIAEKPLKTKQTQNTNAKKRRLSTKSKHNHEVPRKPIRAGKSEKRKVAVKKTNHKKLIKNKHKKTALSHKSVISKTKTSKSSTDKDSEAMTLKDPVDQNNEVPPAENCLESVTEPAQEDVPDITPVIDGSNLNEESNTEESPVSQVSEPSILSLATMKITPESDQFSSEKDSNVNKDNELKPVISTVTNEPVLETQSATDMQPSTISSPAEKSESIPEAACCHEESVLHCTDSASEESENVNDFASNNNSSEQSEELEQPNPSEAEQLLPTMIPETVNDCDPETVNDCDPNKTVNDCDPNKTVNDCDPNKTVNDCDPNKTVNDCDPNKTVNDCDPNKTVHASCEAMSHEPVDIEEDEGIHSHEGSEISDSISERSDDSGLNGLQSPQETLETQPLLEVPSGSTSISNETFVCIFCDRAFKKAEEYTKHLKRHLVNVYYLEKAAQNRL
ncbi:RE1-silencing transcription factor [Bufo bufo]|uniref:RE1-silencing transcription factor n=1 Tax=Bufo bufo TaxID=8384 RepID=UPI001ABE77EA|nr:RE1-silencing transcription factor [Bufo bufo]